MNVAAAIKKGNKLSGTQVTINDRNKHSWIYKGEVISFYANGKCTPEASITGVKSCRVGDKSDSMTDYFPGTFHDNLTQAFRFVDQCHLMSSINKKESTMVH